MTSKPITLRPMRARPDSTGLIRVGRLIAASAAWAVAMVGTGCASEKPFAPAVAVAPAEAGGSLAVVQGDWEDIGAAVSVVLWRFELTTVRASSPAVGVLVYELQGIRDERGELEFRRLEQGAEGEADTIEVRCAVGLDGDPETERGVIRGVAGRLRQLAGVETAPL